jgi:hypothetical protein
MWGGLQPAHERAEARSTSAQSLSTRWDAGRPPEVQYVRVNATDVYVEQLIIGGIVVVIVCVLMTGALPPMTWNKTGVAFAAIAYLVGLLYDRVGDTLLERIEKRQRLEFAREQKPASDPFPEDVYRMKVLRAGDDIAKQYQYLRSRIRLARAMTTLAPAGTIALLVHERAGAGPIVMAAVLLAYAAVFACNHVPPKLPRTDAMHDYDRDFWDAWAPAAVGLTLLAGILYFLAVAQANARSWWIVAAGLALTVVAGWTWLRITGTSMAYLRDVNTKS